MKFTIYTTFLIIFCFNICQAAQEADSSHPKTRYVKTDSGLRPDTPRPDSPPPKKTVVLSLIVHPEGTGK